MHEKVPLRVLIADDEAPARSRLRDLLGDIADAHPTEIVGLAANGAEALRLLESVRADVVLADVRMPVMGGVALARRLAAMEHPPAVIFTTAYDSYAVEAFEIAVTDYLVKPVRAERLAEALGRVHHDAAAESSARQYFSVTERGRIARVPVADVLFLRAQMKYVTATTAEREYLLDESLVQIEQEFPQRYLRVHRNCLVARDAVTGVERVGEDEGDAHWDIVVRGVAERLPVSRRQWATVKHALGL